MLAVTPKLILHGGLGVRFEGTVAKEASVSRDLTQIANRAYRRLIQTDARQHGFPLYDPITKHRWQEHEDRVMGQTGTVGLVTLFILFVTTF